MRKGQPQQCRAWIIYLFPGGSYLIIYFSLLEDQTIPEVITDRGPLRNPITLLSPNSTTESQLLFQGTRRNRAVCATSLSSTLLIACT
jgi:hypothetical protein